jgi:hypothetical protein
MYAETQGKLSIADGARFGAKAGLFLRENGF